MYLHSYNLPTNINSLPTQISYTKLTYNTYLLCTTYLENTNPSYTLANYTKGTSCKQYKITEFNPVTGPKESASRSFNNAIMYKNLSSQIQYYYNLILMDFKQM